jgi:hypothetical protein
MQNHTLQSADELCESEISAITYEVLAKWETQLGLNM